jgi:phosphatidylserine/phosphatidylglycerophosphate/cardiolipin synthase-like enzyme
MTDLPTWVRIETRLVVGHFLNWLAASHAWRRLYLISPWISTIDHNRVAVRPSGFSKRLVDDDCTVYVVTRPPIDPWHAEALESLRDTRCASIVMVPALHTKLFCAETKTGNFALLGSANWTQKSLVNRELGVLISGKTHDGAAVVRTLTREAAEIYRSAPGKTQYCKRSLRRH